MLDFKLEMCLAKNVVQLKKKSKSSQQATPAHEM